jgi:hypothetical protein
LRRQPLPEAAPASCSEDARHGQNLILDLLEWLVRKDHTYPETFDAWRTSCPRLRVWEEATERGLIACEAVPVRTLMRPTRAGLQLLKTHRPQIYREPVQRESARP